MIGIKKLNNLSPECGEMLFGMSIVCGNDIYKHKQENILGESRLVNEYFYEIRMKKSLFIFQLHLFHVFFFLGLHLYINVQH